MAKISDILRRGLSFSFEFFPPRTPEMEETLRTTLVELETLAPSYVSVTYGAGGTTRERTHDIVVDILRTTTMTAMAHLTCAAHTRAELVEIVTRYRDAGIENVLCLGGDPPADLDLPPGELAYAVELVELVRDIGDFSVGVAAHPEPHPKSPSRESDRYWTARKLEKADFAITQFFFEAEHYFDLVAGLRANGVDKPVLPGIMPATNLRSITRMAELQGSEFPKWLADKLYAVGDDKEAVRDVGIGEATKLCQALLDGGAPGLHFDVVAPRRPGPPRRRAAIADDPRARPVRCRPIVPADVDRGTPCVSVLAFVATAYVREGVFEAVPLGRTTRCQCRLDRVGDGAQRDHEDDDLRLGGGAPDDRPIVFDPRRRRVARDRFGVEPWRRFGVEPWRRLGIEHRRRLGDESLVRLREKRVVRLGNECVVRVCTECVVPLGDERLVRLVGQRRGRFVVE